MLACTFLSSKARRHFQDCKQWWRSVHMKKKKSSAFERSQGPLQVWAEQQSKWCLEGWKAETHAAGICSLQVNGPPRRTQTFSCDLFFPLTPAVSYQVLSQIPVNTFSLDSCPQTVLSLHLLTQNQLWEETIILFILETLKKHWTGDKTNWQSTKYIFFKSWVSALKQAQS